MVYLGLLLQKIMVCERGAADDRHSSWWNEAQSSHLETQERNNEREPVVGEGFYSQSLP